jgi:hypothetical protein
MRGGFSLEGNVPMTSFKKSTKNPVLHHFNDHSTCGTWCKHMKNSEAELKK